MKLTPHPGIGSLLVGLSTATFVAVSPAVGADESGAARPSADKSKYHLFNPTPRELMREMSTDRPDKTESAYTVDAGHFQIEMDVVSYSYDKTSAGGVEQSVHTGSIGPINLKAGLCNWSDLQVVIVPWTVERTELSRSLPIPVGPGNVTSTRRGFGDITARLKCNLWGNDGGTTAFAVMPFVKIPTNQDDLGNDDVEGGVILPLAVQLPYGFGMGVMTEFDFIRDEDDGGNHPEFINSITLSHDIVGDLGGYVEFWSLASTEDDSEWVGTFDIGFTYGLTEDLQLDTGVNIGVTDSADDVNPFVGISWRF